MPNGRCFAPSKMKFAARALALILGAAVSGVAAAQSSHGQMGPQSRASIRISISVPPRFAPSPAVSTGRGEADLASYRMTSNAPALRYTLTADPAGGSESGRPGDGSLPLLLIVPD